jgi:cell division protein FtsN
MSPQQEEDYELVLGNRQLFFLAVVLFGVFFSIGYTVGYSRGRENTDVAAAKPAPTADAEASRSSPAAAPTVEPAAAVSSSAKSSEALYSAAPAGSEATPRPPAESSEHLASTPARETALTPARETVAATAAKLEPLARNNPPATAPNLAAAAAPRATTPAAASVRETTPAAARVQAPTADSPKPAPSRESAAPATTVAVAAIEPGTLYLQVLASRDADPARKSLLEFKSKGHPVTLDNQDPDWYRILVGPFTTREAADAYQARLQAEGIKSFLRKF